MSEQLRRLCCLLSHVWFCTENSGFRWITFILVTVWTSACDPGHRLPEQLLPHSAWRQWNKAELGINQVTKRDEDDDTAAAPACTSFCVRVWSRKHLATQAPQPLPGFYANHKGCPCWSMLSLAPFPVTIASERALTQSRTLLQPAVGARRRGEAACCAAELITHTERQNAHSFITKVRTQTCSCYCEHPGFFSLQRWGVCSCGSFASR